MSAAGSKLNVHQELSNGHKTFLSRSVEMIINVARDAETCM